MQLYIANCSNQRRIVCYRPEHDGKGAALDVNRKFTPANQQPIEAGKQIRLGGHMHYNQIEDIVQQLTPYGLLGVVDLPHRDPGVVVPLVFNVDAPVPKAVMERVVAENNASLIHQGHERRRKAAIGVNDIVQRTLAMAAANAGMQQEPEAPTGVEVGFEQLDQSEAGEKRVEEGYRVDPTAAEKPSRIINVLTGRKNKGGRPKGSKNKPKAAAPAAE